MGASDFYERQGIGTANIQGGVFSRSMREGTPGMCRRLCRKNAAMAHPAMSTADGYLPSS